MKTVTLPVYKRADYLARTLDALRSNRVDGYTLYVSVEPGHDDVADLVRSVDFMPAKIIWNRSRLGLNRNVRQALFAAMDDGSEFNVAIEDDVTLSPDAIDLAEWFRSYEKSGDYAALVFCNFDGHGKPRALRPSRKFWSWGYCFRKDGWRGCFETGWKYVEERADQDRAETNWDTHMMRWIMIGRFATLLPDLSRATHIGKDGGTHFLEHNSINHYDRFFGKLRVSDGSVRSGFFVDGSIHDMQPEDFERRMLGKWK